MKTIKFFTKRAFCAILMLCLLLSTAPLITFAAPNLSGMDPTLPVTLTVHHRIMPDGTVLPGTPAGTPPAPQGVPVIGASWQIQRVNLPPGFDWNDPAAVAAIDDSMLVPPPFTATTNAQGQAIFTGMPQGIYLVRELPSAVSSATEVHAPFLVQLPMRHGESWLYSVHVYPKRETDAPAFSKTVAGLNGFAVDWRFSVEIMENLETLMPIPDAAGVYLRIRETLEDNLTFYGPLGVTAHFETAPGVFEQLEGSGLFNFTNTGQDLTIELFGPGRDIIAANGIVGGEIRFQFRTLFQNFTPSLLGDYPNTGTLYYGVNEPHEYGEFPGEVPPVARAFGFELHKVNTAGQSLEGAIFQLFAQNDVIEENGAFIPRPGATSLGQWTTDANGLFSIYGLTEGTYLLVEVAPPAGYNAFTAPLVLEINASTANSAHIVEATVTNTADFELPLTGGMGTILFTAIGLSLIGGAAIALFAALRRRKKRDEDDDVVRNKIR